MMEEEMMSATVEEIEGMKYSDLQRLAKSLGVKANQRMDKLKVALKEAVTTGVAEEATDDKFVAVSEAILAAAAEKKTAARRKTVAVGKVTQAIEQKADKIQDGVAIVNTLEVTEKKVTAVAVEEKKAAARRKTVAAGKVNKSEELQDKEIVAAVGLSALNETDVLSGIETTVAKKTLARRKTVAAGRVDKAAAMEEQIAEELQETIAVTELPSTVTTKRGKAIVVKTQQDKVEETEVKVQHGRASPAGFKLVTEAATKQHDQVATDAVVSHAKTSPAVKASTTEASAVTIIEPRPPLKPATRRSSEVTIQASRKRSNDNRESRADDDEIILQPAKRQKRSGPHKRNENIDNQQTEAMAEGRDAQNITATVSNTFNTTEAKNKGSKTQIPRFQSDLMKKPKQINADYWARVHSKNFDKMDSLDEWVKKKQQRHADLLSPGLAKPLSSNGPAKPTVFIPTVLSTKNINLNFTHSSLNATTDKPKQVSVLNSTVIVEKPKNAAAVAFTAEKPKQVSVLTSTVEKPKQTADSVMRSGIPSLQRGKLEASARKSLTAGNTSINRKSIGGLMSPAGGDPKAKFNLKASLARPITWQAHRGALKPYEVDEKLPGGIKAVKVKTREERRAEAERLRQERRSTVKSNRRNLSANISSVSNVSMQ